MQIISGVGPFGVVILLAPKWIDRPMNISLLDISMKVVALSFLISRGANELQIKPTCFGKKPNRI